MLIKHAIITYTVGPPHSVHYTQLHGYIGLCLLAAKTKTVRYVSPDKDNCPINSDIA